MRSRGGPWERVKARRTSGANSGKVRYVDTYAFQLHNCRSGDLCGNALSSVDWVAQDWPPNIGWASCFI